MSSHDLPIKGETVVKIDNLKEGGFDVKFICASGKVFRMFHEQECCEDVEIEEIHGNVEDLIDSPIITAYRSLSEPPSCKKPENFRDFWNGGYCRWTFFIFRTMKGTVTVRWYGESNGYYAVDATFREGKIDEEE